MLLKVKHSFTASIIIIKKPLMERTRMLSKINSIRISALNRKRTHKQTNSTTGEIN